MAVKTERETDILAYNWNKSVRHCNAPNDEDDEDETLLTVTFHDNPGKPVPECLRSGF